jgi:hypothetical protein
MTFQNCNRSAHLNGAMRTVSPHATAAKVLLKIKNAEKQPRASK